MINQRVGVECEARVRERADLFFRISLFMFMQEFILEPATDNFRVIHSKNKSEKKESDEYAKSAPKINSGATDGGILFG